MKPFSIITSLSLVLGQFSFFLPMGSLGIQGENHPHLALPQVHPACPNPDGQTHQDSLGSSYYQTTIKYSIYLPPCFNEHSSIRYPVIYLLNGQTYDDQQWIDLGVAHESDQLIKFKAVAPFIIVMPNDPDWRQPASSPFGLMLINELIPHIDTTYPTRADRQYRAIGGLSRGASWALRLGLTEWPTFSKIGAHSLPVFANDGRAIPDWLDEIPTASMPLIYIDTGNQDPELNHAREVEGLLSSRHIPHEWHFFIGAHDENYWRKHLGKYLRWYACGWTVMYYN